MCVCVRIYIYIYTYIYYCVYIQAHTHTHTHYLPLAFWGKFKHKHTKREFQFNVPQILSCRRRKSQLILDISPNGKFYRQTIEELIFSGLKQRGLNRSLYIYCLIIFHSIMLFNQFQIPISVLTNVDVVHKSNTSYKVNWIILNFLCFDSFCINQ